MPTLSDDRIVSLLEPYLQTPADVEPRPGSPAVRPLEELIPALSRYLDLLLAWNRRTNLTSIRDPEEMVRRHFGESLFAALCLRLFIRPGDRVLDLGSGAGFPGLPLQLMLPELRVTLAESQQKKAAFLREAIRSTTLRLGEIAAEVWAGRAESMPESAVFQAVTLRAVDDSAAALAVARSRLAEAGTLIRLLSLRQHGAAEDDAEELVPLRTIAMPGNGAGIVRIETAHRCNPASE